MSVKKAGLKHLILLLLRPGLDAAYKTIIKLNPVVATVGVVAVVLLVVVVVVRGLFVFMLAPLITG